MGSASVALEVVIDAPRERVWKSLVLETDRWWLKDFYATQQPQGIYLEPRPGGRLYELGEGDAGVLWYTVIEVAPPEVLSLSGDLAPPYGGPATSLVRLQLEEINARQTRLKLRDSLFGVVNRQTEESIEKGWRALFGEGLKPHAEASAET
jgi:uncharacterized protein YndB with AHSA1/START domain